MRASGGNRTDARHVHQTCSTLIGRSASTSSTLPSACFTLTLTSRQLREEPVDRIVQLHPGPLHQRQQRSTGDRLGHGVQPPDGLIVERGARLEVHRADRGAVGQASGVARRRSGTRRSCRARRRRCESAGRCVPRRSRRSLAASGLGVRIHGASLRRRACAPCGRT